MYSLMYLYWGVCLLVWTRPGVQAAGEGSSRGLLGQAVELTELELSYFGLTGEKNLLIQSKTDCPDPLPLNLRVRNGLLCGFFGLMRSCLNLNDTQPVWIAKECRGQSCLIRNSYEETLCILQNYGVNIDVHNKTRQATCGLDPSDKHFLTEKLDPTTRNLVNGQKSCTVVIPKGVQSYVWAECVKKRPEFRYEFQFSKNKWDMGNETYGCAVSPTCLQKELVSMMVCHNNSTKQVETTMDASVRYEVDGTLGHHESSATEGCWSRSNLLLIIFCSIWMGFGLLSCQ